MKTLLNLLFSKKETTELKPMSVIKIGELKPFNEVSDIIDINLKESYKRKY